MCAMRIKSFRFAFASFNLHQIQTLERQQPLQSPLIYPANSSFPTSPLPTLSSSHTQKLQQSNNGKKHLVCFHFKFLGARFVGVALDIDDDEQNVSRKPHKKESNL